MTAYIGFAKLSEFMAALEPRRDVYLAPLSIVKTGEHISTCTVSLVASQAKADHLIYCKIDISRWQELYGQPFGPMDRDRAARAARLQEQMWQIIVEQLRINNPDLKIYDGAPSFPADLMLVPGNVEGVDYDTDLHEFTRTAIVVETIK